MYLLFPCLQVYTNNGILYNFQYIIKNEPFKRSFVCELVNYFFKFNFRARLFSMEVIDKYCCCTS